MFFIIFPHLCTSQYNVGSLLPFKSIYLYLTILFMSFSIWQAHSLLWHIGIRLPVFVSLHSVIISDDLDIYPFLKIFLSCFQSKDVCLRVLASVKRMTLIRGDTFIMEKKITCTNLRKELNFPLIFRQLWTYTKSTTAVSPIANCQSD